MDRDLEMSEMLEGIKPSMDDYVNRKYMSKSFAQVVLWLATMCRNGEFVTVHELKKFMGYTQQRANAVLNELVDAGIMKKVYKGVNFVEYYFKRDEESGAFYVMKYTEWAQKLLGVKVKVRLEGGK